jgi:uncharacterized protein YbjT (DUF2867 family)
MRIAITGGTGFVGSNLATRLRAAGHDVVVLSRRTGHRLEPGHPSLAEAFLGCDAVVHCAGINREIGAQTYAAVHLLIRRLAERTMRIPLISVAQVHILAEGVVDVAPFGEAPPPDLVPSTPFSAEAIRRGLPAPGGFGRTDLRCAT